jgi:hypothetical protein
VLPIRRMYDLSPRALHSLACSLAVAVGSSGEPRFWFSGTRLRASILVPGATPGNHARVVLERPPRDLLFVRLGDEQQHRTPAHDLECRDTRWHTRGTQSSIEPMLLAQPCTCDDADDIS